MIGNQTPELQLERPVRSARWCHRNRHAVDQLPTARAGRIPRQELSDTHLSWRLQDRAHGEP